MLNLGGYHVKENRMGTFGYLTPFTFAEDEEACLSVGWSPYHVTQGYDLNSSTVTAASALQWGNNVTPATDDPEIIMTLMAWDITEKQQNGLGNTNAQVYRTVLITEEVARDLAAQYRSKDALEDALIETARRPLWMRTFANYWANTGSQQFSKRTFQEHYDMLLNDPEEQAALTDAPAWLEGIVDGEQIMTIATMRKGETPLLIAGDSVRNKFQVMPGGGYVTIEIELPENWNDLVAPLGYEPLEQFCLNPADYAEQVPAPKATETAGETAVPAALADGPYRLVPSAKQVTGSGRVAFADGVLTYWDEQKGCIGHIQIASAGAEQGFHRLLRALGSSCSFTVESGQISAVVLRPSTNARKPVTDASALTADDLSGVELILSVTTRQSAEAGSVSPDGSRIILSDTLTSFKLDLGGAAEISTQHPAGFVAYRDDQLMIDRSAPAGAEAVIRIITNKGAARTLTLTKSSNSAIIVTFHSGNARTP